MLYDKFVKFLLLLTINNVKSQLLDTQKHSSALYGEPWPMDGPKIYYMKVSTQISNRYAKTLITCRMKNPSVVGKEATFSVVLPEKAFISGLVMEINNETYPAHVAEKKRAQMIYDRAVDHGQAAAQVKSNARYSHKFSVNVHLEPEARAIYQLTYEELLVRKRGKYEVILNIFPNQPVDNLQMEVTINETQPLKFVNTPFLRQADKLMGKQVIIDAQPEKSDKSAFVQFRPDVFEQRRIARSLETGENYGLAGQFVLQYDVDRKSTGGDVIQTRSNFAHFFSPVNTTTLSKYVVFVLDTSSSMEGDKLDQLKQAMKNILDQLSPGDSFNIVEFSYSARIWDVTKGEITYEKTNQNSNYFGIDSKKTIIPPSHQANKDNIERSFVILNLLDAFGSTDIESALEVGLMLIKKNTESLTNVQSNVVFLTDGEATYGEHSYKKIIEKITKLNDNRASIFTLSLGKGANKDFLERLSLQNAGNTKHIYESDDIYLQLESFFQEISSPQLKDVRFHYGPGVSKLSRTIFPTAYADEELVIVGKKDANVDLHKAHDLVINATSSNGNMQLVPSVETATDDMKRLWAFLRVKQLLDQRKIVENNTAITKEALELALKYSFVTDITSLVVVKPGVKIRDDDESSTNDQNMARGDSGGPIQGLGPDRFSIDDEDPIWGHTDDKIIGGNNSNSYFPGDFSASNGTIPINYHIINGHPTNTRPTIPPRRTTPSPQRNRRKYIVTEEGTKNIIKVKQELTWLADKLSENGTLTTASGELQLDFSSNTTNPRTCSFTWDEEHWQGTCLRLHECQQNYKTVIDTYLIRSLCNIYNKPGLFGVCCATPV